MACHHPHLSRLKADDLLKSAEQDGSYLIRNSESLSGVYILCLLSEGRVHQYRIMKNEETGLIFIPAESASNQREYSDLRQLIQELTLRGDKNGLRCALRHPINRQENEEESEDEDEGCTSNHSSTSSGLMSSSSSSQTLSSASSLSSPISPPGGQPPALPVSLVPVSASNVGSQPAGQSKRKMSLGVIPAAGSDVTKYLMKRFNNIDSSTQDGQFINGIHNYVSEGINSDIRAESGEGAQLKQLLISNSDALHRQTQDFQAKLTLLNTLFGLPGAQTRPISLDKDARSFEILKIAQNLEQCAQMLTTFHTQASDYIKDLQSQQKKEPVVQSSLPKEEKPAAKVPEGSFKVAGSKLGKFNERIELRVNISSGKLHIFKIDKSKTEDYLHDAVEQVVKSLNNNKRVSIKFTGKNKMNSYEFTDVWQRETFCQYICQMKKEHAGTQNVDEISVFVGTWNMGSDNPHNDLTPWFQSQGLGKVRDQGLSVMGHDMYVIGTQEASIGEKEWISKIKDTISTATTATTAANKDNRDFHVVTCVSSWSIRMVVLVKMKYKNRITRVMSDSVKTGIANTLGNKGGVGVSFSFDGTSFCFVNCHLTSGHERNARRNQNAHDIIKGLSGLKPKGSLPACDIISQFHHVFFLGDLNYRLEDEDPAKIVTMIQTTKKAKNPNYSDLLKLDQLKKTQERKEAFIEFKEEEIHFPPTYRIQKGSRDTYEYQKFKATGLRINAPSWCDRVLLHSYPDTHNKCTSYGCVEDIMTSDHKPVFASYDIGITSSQTSRASNNNITNQNVKIIFQEVIAELKSSCKFTSQIDFFSSCLQSVVSSKPNTETVKPNTDDFCCPKWSSYSLPPALLPLFDDRDYIADQHLILCVKNEDSQESYGECVLSLKSMISKKPEPFRCQLTHNGEETGSIRGFMHVLIKESQSKASFSRRRRSYEYITTEPLFLKMNQTLSTIQDDEPQQQSTGPLQKSSSFDGACTSQAKYRDTGRRSGPPGSSTGLNVTSPVSPSGSGGMDSINNNNSQIAGPQHGQQHGQTSQNGQLLQTQTEGRSRSRPRMGQSSLSSGPVLPISGLHPTAATPPGGQDDNQNPWNTMGNKRLGTPQEGVRPLGLYDNASQVTLVQTTLRPLPLNMSQAEPNYESLKPPITVNEWLLDLSLPMHITTFFQQGWDSMYYVIKDLDPVDLDNMDIKDPAHVKRIMESLADMRKLGVAIVKD